MRATLRLVFNFMDRDLTRRESETGEARLRRLSKVFTDSIDAIFVKGLDERIIEVNAAAERQTGYNSAELIGQHISLIVPEDELAQREEWMARCLRGEEIRGVEASRLRKSGETLPVLLTFSLLTDDDGAPMGIATISEDISERKRAETDLYRSEETNSAILNATADAIITIDRQGVIVSVNPATERMFGYSSQQLLGRNVSILMPSPFREEHDGYLARYHETGEAKIIGVGREVEARRADGSVFPANLAVGKIDGLGLFTGVIRDITESKLAEAELRRRHEFAESLIETAQCIVLVLDTEGRIMRYNPVLEEITGRSLEETRGKDWFETFLPERDRMSIGNLFEKAVDGQRTRGNVNPILTRDGEEREIEWFDAPLTDSDGRLVGLLCTGVDITERLLLEKEVYEAAEEEKNRIARELHDGLGALLSGGRMIAAALAGKLRAGDPVGHEDMEAVSEHLREAIAQTRALSQGLQPVSAEPGALFDTLKRFSQQIDTAARARCRFVAPHGVVDFPRVNAANHLYRIAQEAVHNAIRHSEAADVTIRLDQRGEQVELTVKDDGKGFDASHHAPGGDRGIGLHTMQYRANAIGGELRIDSAPGQGTRVVCRAPLKLGSSPRSTRPSG